MPPAEPAGNPPDPQRAPQSDGEDLVFAPHDRGRDRAEPGRQAEEDVTFAVAPRTREAVPPQRRPDAPAAAEPAASSPPGTPGFQVTTSSVQRPARDDQLPWTVRDASVSAPRVSRRGWSARESEVLERAAKDTMRRLREDAVEVSWKAAWIAMTSAARRRRQP